MAATAYHVPGVYYEPRPRAVEPAVVRTDVAAFIGFEPRVRNGSTPSTLTWAPALPPPSPPAGHAFRVDVSAFQLVVGGVRGTVPATRDLVLSEHAAAIPVTDGQSIAYAIVAAERLGTLHLVVAAGVPEVSGGERAADDAAVVAAVTAALGPGRAWQRLVDVVVRREGTVVWLTVLPVPPLSVTRCDDWRDYLLALGDPADDGTLLGPAVRTFFANGGRRCWVATVRRPDFEDAKELARTLDDIVGVPGSSELEATGLERVLLVPEATFVDVPDLYATRVDTSQRSLPLPPSEREACFLDCRDLPPRGSATTGQRTPAWRPIFDSYPLYAGGGSNDVFDTQRRLLARVLPERWRMLLLLSVPRLPDGGSGPYVPPTDRDADAWRAQFDRVVKIDGLATTEEVSCAALYWPWLLEQPEVDGALFERPPSPFAAGIIARRDLARGPQIAAANETLLAVVAVATPVGDDADARLYDPDPDAAGLPIPAVNVFRPFPRYGIQLWGARTLSTDPWLRFLSVRRTLTAIELRMKAALDLLVFEPNTPMLWLHITQLAFEVLMPLFESGALRGSRPEEAFSIRCDSSVNPPDVVALGQLYVEIGVAIAAPAEFLVFRVGRREGVTEVLE